VDAVAVLSLGYANIGLGGRWWWYALCHVGHFLGVG
jgi:hypothetical protein